MGRRIYNTPDLQGCIEHSVAHQVLELVRIFVFTVETKPWLNIRTAVCSHGIKDVRICCRYGKIANETWGFSELVPAACSRWLPSGWAALVIMIESARLIVDTSWQQSRIIPMLSTQLAADVVVSLTLCLALPEPTHEGCVSLVQATSIHFLITHWRTRHVTRSIIVYTASRGIVTA